MATALRRVYARGCCGTIVHLQDVLTLDFRILGELEVDSHHGPLDLGGPKQRAVLALLVLDAGRVVSVDRLVDGLWGEAPPPTALNTVQVYVSRLRRTLGEQVVESHPTGYLLRAAPDAVDLARFERLWRLGLVALEGGDLAAALEPLGMALSQWRGHALADFMYEPFAEHEARRLEEMRVQAAEDYADARLRANEKGAITVELESMVRLHPTRERLRALFMLSLYRAGRQQDALATARELRRALSDDLGIAPTPVVAELERRILNHDPTLLLPGLPAKDSSTGDRSLEALRERRSVACIDAGGHVDWLARLGAELCAGAIGRELVVASLVSANEPELLGSETRRLAELRGEFETSGIPVRVAAFTTTDPSADASRFTASEEIDLVLADGRPALRGEDPRPGLADQLLANAPCDAGLVVSGDRSEVAVDRGILVPFGGSEHDWAALELGAWVARSHDAPLAIAGVQASATGRDSSRLLADASLLLQRSFGVIAEPILIGAGAEDLLARAAEYGLLVVGLSPEWRRSGLGPVRFEIASRSPVVSVFVRRGLRPGVLTPRADGTRFRWSSVSQAAAMVGE